MTPSEIIETLGGRALVAEATGSDANTVLYWERRGRIPAKHFQALVAAAQRTEGAEAVTFEMLHAHSCQHVAGVA